MSVRLHVCNGRAGGVQTLLQPARAQSLRLSERFFSFINMDLVSDINSCTLHSHFAAEEINLQV